VICRAREACAEWRMSDTLSRVIVVTDGPENVELKTFDDIRSFLMRAENAPLGIARVLNMARSQDQKQLAVLVFTEWARVNGVLVELQAA
jgi:hypothetical protein